MWWNRKRRIYLDYAAATPVRREVLFAMAPYFNREWGNASAIHKEGVTARKAVEAAREEAARTLRVRAEHVTFTSGGTESNNLALLGTIASIHDAGVPYEDMEIISTKLEHPSVLKTLEHLGRLGLTINYAPVDEDGLIIEAEFQKLLTSKTRLVTFAYANSETGVISDINRFGRLIKEFEKKNNISIYFHTDASQAPLWLPCQLDALAVDLLTLDAGKCYGPKGIGVLVHRQKIKLSPIMWGGSQEAGLRPGTENTAPVVGAAKAISIAQKLFPKRSEKVKQLRDRFLEELEKIEGVVLNGSRAERLPNNVNISIPGLDSEYAVVSLDEAGVAASTKSACSGAGGGGSHVVFEMTKDRDRASSTIRFTLGEGTTGRELSKTVMMLREHINKMKLVSVNG